MSGARTSAETRARDVRTREAAPVLLPRLFSRSALDRAARSFLTLPFWLQALSVFLVSRCVSLAIMAIVVRTQPEAPWSSGAVTTLNDFLNFWDGGWYSRVAQEGYPEELPTDGEGRVFQNAWAFYPLFPWLTRVLGGLTGVDFETVAPVLSTVCAGAASVVLLALFRHVTTPGRALTGLAFVLFFPASPVLGTAYAEALTLLLQACALLCVVQRRYWLALLPVVLMDLSRPVGVAFSFFMLIHLVSRFLRRAEDPYPRREVVSSWALGVLSCAAALLHPAHAWLRTGSFTAYTDTEAAWHTGQTRIFVQWLDAGTLWMGPAGPAVVVLLVVAMVLLLVSPAGRTMGRTLQQHCWGYGVYLLLFFTPQTSTARLFLPLFPFALALAYVRSWALRAVVLLAFTVLQLFWVGWLWHFTPPGDLPP
ncbi:hypothetical protein [Brevibacterium sp.]|uniref:hypothetical protein n=1 Tax=Brevibacterium sp. TaxID=1701 RepID=UPI0025BE96F5|nr:hypothetical protein [Brevibacterium sp.]